MEVQIAKLAEALAKAQGAMLHAKKDANNPHYKSKYADLASVWEACRKPLSDNGLSIMQPPCSVDGVTGIKTILAHSSGEAIESFLPLFIPATATPQQVGSAITYARRYSLASMVGIAPDDDDGNEANEAAVRANSKPEPKAEPKLSPEEQELADGAKKYAEEIALCDSEEKLELVVKRNLTLMTKLVSILPKYHARIVKLLDIQRNSFEQVAAPQEMAAE